MTRAMREAHGRQYRGLPQPSAGDRLALVRRDESAVGRRWSRRRAGSYRSRRSEEPSLKFLKCGTMGDADDLRGHESTALGGQAWVTASDSSGSTIVPCGSAVSEEPEPMVCRSCGIRGDSPDLSMRRFTVI